MKNIKNKIATYKSSLKDKYRLFTNWVYEIEINHLHPLRKKLGYFLTHNFFITLTINQVIFFRLIKLKVTNYRREALIGYLFIMLWLIGFLIFTAYPVFYSLYLTFNQAFFKLSGIVTTNIGLKNYQNVLSDATLLPLYTKYIGKIVFSVPLIIVFAIMIALLINQPIKGKGLFRTIFFLPVVISTGPVLGELIAQGATSLPSLSDSMVTKAILNYLPSFINTPLITLFDSMLFILWYAGIPVLIFLAGLQKINREIYEAAAVDGASPWDTFWKITIPSIKPLISVNIIYIVVSMSLYVEAEGILDLAKVHMLQGAPDTLWNGYGYAAAIAWVYFMIMVIIILLYVGLLSIRKRRA